MQPGLELTNTLEIANQIEQSQANGADTVKLPKEWTQLCGDLKKVFEENSTEFVVFEKTLTKSDEAMLKGSGLKKTNEDFFKEYNQLVRIMLVRQYVFYDVLSNHHRVYEESELQSEARKEKLAQRKILCLYLFFSDGKEKINQFTLKLTNTVANQRIYGNSNEKWLHDFEVYPGHTYQEERFANTLMKEGSLFAWGERIFMLDNIHPFFIEPLFEKLVENQVLRQDEAEYFQTVFQGRKPGSLEQILNEKVKKALEDKKFDEAIDACRQIHDLYKGDPRNANKASCYQWDYSGACFELGAILETISPEHAIKALKLFEEYAINKGPNSPFQHKGLHKLFDIYYALSGQDKIEEEARRMYQTKAISMLAILIEECEDKTEEAYLNTQLINILELHCGNHPHDFGSRALKDLNPELGFRNRRSDFNIMLKLADIIYKLKKSSLNQHENQPQVNQQEASPVLILSGLNVNGKLSLEPEEIVRSNKVDPSSNT